MNWQQGSFNTNNFRPKPEIYVDQDGTLLVIATPWGPRSVAEKAIQILQDIILSSRNDIEVTSPFDTLTCLSPIGNNLRSAMRIVNDTIYKEDNNNEYVGGIELLALTRNENEIVWAQVGQPNLFLDRPSHNQVVPLGYQHDASFDLSQNNEILAPMPNQLLGTDPTSNFCINILTPQENDKFFVVSRSTIPSELYTLKSQDRNIDNLRSLLSKKDEEMPFWLGVLEL